MHALIAPSAGRLATFQQPLTPIMPAQSRIESDGQGDFKKAETQCKPEEQ